MQPLVERFALGLIQVVASVIYDQLQHRPLRQSSRFIKLHASIFDQGTKRHEGSIP